MFAIVSAVFPTFGPIEIYFTIGTLALTVAALPLPILYLIETRPSAMTPAMAKRRRRYLVRRSGTHGYRSADRH